MRRAPPFLLPYISLGQTHKGASDPAAKDYSEINIALDKLFAPKAKDS